MWLIYYERTTVGQNPAAQDTLIGLLFMLLANIGEKRHFERPVTSSCRGGNGLFCSNIYLSMTLTFDTKTLSPVDRPVVALCDLRTKHNLPSLQFFTSELNLYEWRGFPSTLVQCMLAVNKTKNSYASFVIGNNICFATLNKLKTIIHPSIKRPKRALGGVFENL